MHILVSLSIVQLENYLVGFLLLGARGQNHTGDIGNFVAHELVTSIKCVNSVTKLTLS